MTPATTGSCLTLLESYVLALIAVDRFELAAVLLGFHSPPVLTRAPLARARENAAREQVQAALEPERFAALTQEGATISVDEAVELVLIDLARTIEVAPA